MTVVNSLLGRIHLSGRLDKLLPHQFDLIKEGMDVYRSIRSDLRTATAFWPLGLSQWLFGTALVFDSLFSASYATRIWHLLLSQGVCFGFGMGFLYLTAMAILPPWFSTKRSFAIDLAASGSGIGGIVYNLASGHTIETMGWQTTYRILAFCALGSNLISSLLLRDRKQTWTAIAQRTFNHRDLGNFQVLLMIVWGVSTELGYIALIYSLPHYASSIGLSPQQGSVAGAVLNLGLAIGRPLTGYISDNFGRITVLMLMTAFCAVVCFAVWIPAQTHAPLLVFAILSGMVSGTFWGTITPVTAEVVGLSRLPSTFAMVCLLWLFRPRLLNP